MDKRIPEMRPIGGPPASLVVSLHGHLSFLHANYQCCLKFVCAPSPQLRGENMFNEIMDIISPIHLA
jgi:hypothetical protein